MFNNKKIKDAFILEIAGQKIRIGSDSVSSEGKTNPHIIEILRKASGKGVFMYIPFIRDSLKNNEWLE